LTADLRVLKSIYFPPPWVIKIPPGKLA